MNEVVAVPLSRRRGFRVRGICASTGDPIFLWYLLTVDLLLSMFLWVLLLFLAVVPEPISLMMTFFKVVDWLCFEALLQMHQGSTRRTRQCNRRSISLCCFQRRRRHCLRFLPSLGFPANFATSLSSLNKNQMNIQKSQRKMQGTDGSADQHDYPFAYTVTRYPEQNQLGTLFFLSRTVWIQQWPAWVPDW